MLVGQAHAAEIPEPVVAREAIVDVEGVEPDLQHELQLVGEHVAGGAKLAGKAFEAQLAGDGIGTTVGEGGKVQDDELQALDVDAQRLVALAVGKNDAEAAVVLDQRIPVALQAREGDDDVAARRRCLVVGKDVQSSSTKPWDLSSGIERLLEGLGADPPIGGEERLVLVRAQLQIGIDDLLDRVRHLLGRQSRAR